MRKLQLLLPLRIRMQQRPSGTLRVFRLSTSTSTEDDQEEENDDLRRLDDEYEYIRVFHRDCRGDLVVPTPDDQFNFHKQHDR